MSKQIYVIEHPNWYYKIGRSEDPQNRLGSLQTASPYELELLTTLDAINDVEDKSVESLLHAYYRNLNHRGEWYKLPIREVAALEQIDELRASHVYYVIYDLYGTVSSDPSGKSLAEHIHDVHVIEQSVRRDGL